MKRDSLKKGLFSCLLATMLICGGAGGILKSSERIISSAEESEDAFEVTEGCFDAYTDSEYYYDPDTDTEDTSKTLLNYPAYFNQRALRPFC